MTLRGLGLLLGGAALVVAGWFTGWPSLTVLGACAVVLVLGCCLRFLTGHAVTAVLDTTAIKAVRGDAAQVRVTLSCSRGRRRVRLVQGDVAEPLWTMPAPVVRSKKAVTVALPVDTSRRGEHPLGPYTAVAGDMWSIVRRVVAVTAMGTVQVRPRTHPVRRGFASNERVGEADALTRQSGEDHFFALRDYVLGDEPRSVHWRSSARSGRLVVKQRVAAANEGVLIVLDVDAAAYPATDAFGEGFLPERFEQAVEAAASLARAKAEEGLRLHFGTTEGEQSSRVREGVEHALQALTAVQPVSADKLDGGALRNLIRRTRCSSVIVVSGDPGPGVRSAVVSSGAVKPMLVRVGGLPQQHSSRVVHVPDARGLA